MQPFFFPWHLIIIFIILNFCFFYPKLGLYILPLSFCFSPEIIIGQTAAREITIRLEDLVIGVLLLRLVFDFIMRRFEVRGLNIIKKITVPLFLYSLCLVIATTFGIMLRYVSPTAGFFYVLKLIQFFLFFYVFFYYISSEKDVKIILASALFSMLILSLIGLYQIPTYSRTTMPFEGTSTEPNTFGGYYILLGSILGALLAHEPKGNRKVFYIILFGLSVMPFIYTGSRTSWAAAMVSFMCFLFLTKGLQRKIVIMALLIILIMLIPLLPGQIKERAKFWKPEEGYKRTQAIGKIQFDPSGSDRIEKYKKVPEEWPKSPIFGFGVTGKGFIDGQYIRVILETGLLGVLAFCYLFFSILKYIYSVYRTTRIPLQKSLSLGFFCCTIGLLFHGLGATTFYIVRISESYWMFMALVFCYNKFGEAENVKFSANNKYNYPFLISNE